MNYQYALHGVVKEPVPLNFGDLVEGATFVIFINQDLPILAAEVYLVVRAVKEKGSSGYARRLIKANVNTQDSGIPLHKHIPVYPVKILTDPTP